jgi:hypothetical protein
MPVRIRQLSRREEAEYLTRLQQMQAEGIAVEIPERWLEKAHSLDIFITGGFATSIFDLPGGGAAFAVWVRLVAQRRVTLLDCAIRTAWDDQIVLEAFFDERPALWRLGHQDFPRSRVLNMSIMDSLHFQSGKMVEGVILFSGLKPIPEGYEHGQSVPFTLDLMDQDENGIRQNDKLFVDRTWKRKTTAVRPNGGLYEGDILETGVESARTLLYRYRPTPIPGFEKPSCARKEVESAQEVVGEQCDKTMP